MAKDIGLGELLELKMKLQDDIAKAIETDLKKFYERTEVAISGVTVGLNDTNSISYILCELRV